MNKTSKTLLIELMNKPSLHGRELAGKIQMSTRSLRTIVKNINEDLSGAKIESGSFGYRLIVENPTDLLNILQQDDNENSNIERFDLIFERFVNNCSYLRIDDLSEELYLSRTQIKNELKSVRNYLNKYDLTIESRPRHGMRLTGREINIRRAIAHHKRVITSQSEYDAIRGIIISNISNYGYHISDEALDNLIWHMYIAYKRIISKNPVNIETNWISEIVKEPEYPMACSIIGLMSKIMKFEYCESEVAYLTIHLCAKHAKKDSNIYITQDIYDSVNKMLQTIENQSGIAFTLDFNLQLAMSMHMLSLAKRIKYSTYMTNSMAFEIKRKLIVAYEFAVMAAQVINEVYGCSLPEEEIAYFAIHINLSLEQRLNNNLKKNILIVCSSGAGSARMLEFFFRKHFQKFIRNLDIVSKYELIDMNIVKYDCMFSTIPLQDEYPIPVFLIDHFIDDGDVRKIEAKLDNLDSRNIEEYFPKALFFDLESYGSKEEAIREIVVKCEKVYDLPENFGQLILEREEMATTEFNDLIAFPHPHKPIAKETFVSVSVLRKPVRWENNDIRIIILSSIENRLDKELGDFYKVLSTLLSNQTLQWQLIQNPNYEELIKIVRGILTI